MPEFSGLSGDEGVNEALIPFGIDNGQLRGLSKRKSFAMGVEWALVYHALETKQEINRLVVRENAVRLWDLCRRFGRLPTFFEGSSRGVFIYACPSSLGRLVFCAFQCILFVSRGLPCQRR